MQRRRFLVTWLATAGLYLLPLLTTVRPIIAHAATIGCTITDLTPNIGAFGNPGGASPASQVFTAYGSNIGGFGGEGDIWSSNHNTEYGYWIATTSTATNEVFQNSTWHSLVGLPPSGTSVALQLYAPSGIPCTTIADIESSWSSSEQDAPTTTVTTSQTNTVTITSAVTATSTGYTLASNECASASPTPTPTAGPTPTSGYVPCAIAVSDPIDNGTLQDTALLLGLPALALLTAIAFGLLRIRSRT